MQSWSEALVVTHVNFLVQLCHCLTCTQHLHVGGLTVDLLVVVTVGYHPPTSYIRVHKKALQFTTDHRLSFPGNIRNIPLGPALGSHRRGTLSPALGKL